MNIRNPIPLPEKRCLRTVPAWFSLIANLMILLVAVFILLFSASSTDLKKWAVMKEAFQASLGGGASSKEKIQDPSLPSEFQNKVILARLGEKLRLAMADLIREGRAVVVESEDGFLLRLDADGLFYRGTVRIRSDAEPVLLQIAELVATYPNLVIITGHTDDSPPDKASSHPTNWAVSAAYAAGVVDYMVRKGGVDPRGLEIRAKGEFSPLESNETSEGQARNRRVEILVSRHSAKIQKAVAVKPAVPQKKEEPKPKGKAEETEGKHAPDPPASH